MVGRWRRDAAEGISGSAVDDLLQMSPLQRLAREKITELEVPCHTCPALLLSHGLLCCIIPFAVGCFSAGLS